MLPLSLAAMRAQITTERREEKRYPVDTFVFPFVAELLQSRDLVYDRDGNEIADVNDVLINNEGKVIALVIGLGGVLGAGEKNVAIAFEALEVKEEDQKHHLVLDLSPSTLDLAPGFDFDRANRRWVPAASRLLGP